MSNNRNSPAQLQVRPFLSLFLKPQPSRTSLWMDLSSVGRLYKVIRLLSLSCINICPEIRHSCKSSYELNVSSAVGPTGGCFDVKLAPTWILKVKYRELPCTGRSRCTTKVWLYVHDFVCKRSESCFNVSSIQHRTTIYHHHNEDDDLAIKHPSSRAKATQGWKYVA